MSTEQRPSWATGLTEKDCDLAMRGSFTVAAAVAYTGVSDKTIRRLIKEGALEAKRIGNGFRISKSSLDACFPGLS